jgi:hypothetical protein
VPYGPIPYAFGTGNFFAAREFNWAIREIRALISESQILQEADVGGQDDRGGRGYIKKVGSTPCATNAKERVKE